MGETPWAKIIFALAAAVLIVGFVFTAVSVEPFRSVSFWLLLLISASAIVGAVGWAYTEIRRQETLSRQSEGGSASRAPTNARRVLGYAGVLIVVALIAVAGSLVPPRYAPVIWAVYIPLWLVGGWWVRRKSRKRKRR